MSSDLLRAVDSVARGEYFNEATLRSFRDGFRGSKASPASHGMTVGI